MGIKTFPVSTKIRGQIFIHKSGNLNSEKCHYMCIRKNCTNDTFLHNDKKFKYSKEETILGVITDKKLSFDSHINKISEKAGQKLTAL